MISRLDSYLGRQIFVAGASGVINGVCGDTKTLVVTLGDGRIMHLTGAEARQALSLGAPANDETRDQELTTSHLPQPTDEDILTGSFRVAVTRRLKQLLLDGYSWQAARAALESMRITEHSRIEIRIPSVRGLRKWLKAFEEHGPEGLLGRIKQRGNRVPRYDEVAEEIAEQVIEESFLDGVNVSVAAAAATFRKRYREKCKELGREPGNCGVKVFTHILRSVPQAQLVESLHGKEIKGRRLLMALRHIKIESPLERVELDTFELDVFIVNEDGEVIGRPILCAMIDVATGVILGFTIAIGPPKPWIVIETIRRGMSPKTTAMFEEYGIVNRLDAYGRPDRLVCDNGPENTGEQFERMVAVLHMEVHKTKPRSPEKKPFIERLGRLLQALARSLPGGIVYGDGDKGPYLKVAAQRASLTLKQLEAAFTKWVYDVYHVRPRRRVASGLMTPESPADCWRRKEAEFYVPAPPTPEEVRRLIMVRREVRTLQLDGLQFENVKFHSHRLAELIERIGTQQPVEIWVNLEDLREIDVIDPQTNERFTVPSKQRFTAAVSVEDMRARMRDPLFREQEYTAQQQAYDIVLREHQAATKSKSKSSRDRRDAARMKQDLENQLGRRAEPKTSPQPKPSPDPSTFNAPRPPLDVDVPEDLAPMKPPPGRRDP
jgi:transposase InsO family protein